MSSSAASTPIEIVLVGRPNAGKSAMFNRLTGGSAHVGNFPGVTVDILEADLTLSTGVSVTVFDLPGFYSLDARLAEGTDEHVAYDFLTRCLARDRTPTVDVALVQVLDASQLAAGLRLTRELQQRFPEARLLVVASQLDLLTRDSLTLDTALLAEKIQAPVVAVSARDPASRAAVLGAIEGLLALTAVAPTSWDPEVVGGEVIRNSDREPDDTSTTEASNESAPTRLPGHNARAWTDRVDAVFLHPLFGPVLFVAIMAALFASVFLIADPVASGCDLVVQWLGKLLRPALGGGTFASMIVDGALGGAGTVAAFLPQIIILIAMMEVLEASGYLSRAAFLVDRLFRATGLGGKAFVPLLTAHACAVPAIASTRVLRDPNERLTAILVIPLMACSARLPVYSLVVAAFFGGSTTSKVAVCTALYFIGIISGLIASLVFRRTVTRGRGLPLLLEMPVYRRPLLRTVLVRCGRESVDFLRRVGTIILAFSVILWALLTVTVRPESFPDEPVIERSVAATMGRALEPVTHPIGFDWRINVGLIASFGARELMVSTLGVIFGVEGANDDPAPLATKITEAHNSDGTKTYSTASALSLLTFFVFACQCMSTVSAVRRETRGWRWPAFLLGYTYALAYVASGLVFQIARLFGG